MQGPWLPGPTESRWKQPEAGCLCHPTHPGHILHSLSLSVCQDPSRQGGRSVHALGVLEPRHPTEPPLNCNQVERGSSELPGETGSLRPSD